MIAAPQAGEVLVVIGGSLSAILGGRIAGCSSIILIEPQVSRREKALELGADRGINPAALQ